MSQCGEVKTWAQYNDCASFRPEETSISLRNILFIDKVSLITDEL